MQQELQRRHWAAKFIFVVFVSIIAIDTLPLGISNDSGPFSFIYKLKSTIRPALRPIGLWQSEWRLFAPDPVLSNGWWTIEVRGDLAAELHDELSHPSKSSSVSSSNELTWNSPFWGQVAPAEKFFKRRYIAYFRRLSEFPVSVTQDFADDWVRQRFGNRLHPIGDVPIGNGPLDSTRANGDVKLEPCALELSVYRNELKLAPPDDGTLPTREETIWLSVTEKKLQRRYAE